MISFVVDTVAKGVDHKPNRNVLSKKVGQYAVDGTTVTFDAFVTMCRDILKVTLAPAVVARLHDLRKSFQSELPSPPCAAMPLVPASSSSSSSSAPASGTEQAIVATAKPYNFDGKLVLVLPSAGDEGDAGMRRRQRHGGGFKSAVDPSNVLVNWEAITKLNREELLEKLIASVTENERRKEFERHLQRKLWKEREQRRIGKAITNDAIAEHKELESKVYLRDGIRNVSATGGYHLALSKNRAGAGHTSGSAALALVGGQPWQGALQDKGIISRFETYTTVAQRLTCKDNREKADAAISLAVVAVGDPEARIVEP